MSEQRSAKPSVSELREIAQWLKEQAGGLNGHLKRCACVVQSAADWIEGATDETAAPRDVPNEGLTPQQIARGERSGVLRDAVKTAAQAEPRRMYELDGSGSDEKPAGAAVAESRLVFPASDTEQAPHDCPTSKQAIERLCALMSAVNERIFKCEGPADCVCPGAFRDPSGYRNDGRAVEFIEAAVRAAMGKKEVQK